MVEVRCAARRSGSGGEYPLQDGFGWTNGVTRKLLDMYPGMMRIVALRRRAAR